MDLEVHCQALEIRSFRKQSSDHPTLHLACCSAEGPGVGYKKLEAGYY